MDHTGRGLAGICLKREAMGKTARGKGPDRRRIEGNGMDVRDDGGAEGPELQWEGDGTSG